MKLFLIILSTYFLWGCSLNTNIERSSILNKSNDFLKTEIVVGEPVPADGSSNLLVVIHLKNSDNNPVKEFLPTYTVTEDNSSLNNSLSNSVVTTPCSTSDNNGISACILKSSAAGSLLFVLTNAKVGLSKTVVFTAAKGTSNLNIVSGSVINGSTPEGSKLQMTLGNPFDGVEQTTSGGFKVKLGSFVGEGQ